MESTLIFFLYEIYPQRGVGTSGTGKLMKNITKEEEVWCEFYEGSRLKDTGQKGHNRGKSYITNDRSYSNWTK